MTLIYIIYGWYFRTLCLRKKKKSKDLNITVEMGLTDMDYKPQKSSFDFMASFSEDS